MESIFRKRSAGYLEAILSIVAVTAICAPFYDRLADTTVALALLLAVLLVATRWGSGPALLASVLGMLCFNFFFLEPVYTLTIGDPANWVALTAFLITAVTVGQLSARAKRRAAEADAGRKEARLATAYNRSLIEANLDPLVAIGPDGKITDVNVATETVTGHSRAELIATDFSDYFTEPEKARAGYQRAFREGIVRDYTLELRHRDGHTIPVLYNASVYRDETGEVVGVFAAARAITEHQRGGSEMALSERMPPVRKGGGAREGTVTPSEPKTTPAMIAFTPRGVLRAILATLPPFVAVVLQWVFWPLLTPFVWILVYPAVFVSSWIGGRSAGLWATAISTMLVWWFFLPPEHSLVKEDPRLFLAAGVFVGMGILFSLFHGRLRRATQEATGSLAAARSANGKLQAVNAEITRLVEEASDGIFIADLDGRYTDVNSAGCLMLGYTREEIVGTTILDLVPPEDVERLWQAQEQLLKGGIQITEWTLRRKDGTYLPVEVSAKILPDGRWQGFVRDITQRKRADSEIMLLARLQSVVAELGQRALRNDRSGNLLDEAVGLIARALDVEYCNVLELLPDGTALRLRSGVGWQEGLVGRATVGSATDSQAGYTLLSNAPVIVEDLRTETRFSEPPLLHEHGVVSGMSVAIATSEGPYGVLGAHTKQRRRFTRDEVHFLQAVANLLGMTIERGRADEALRASEANLNRAQEIAHIGSWYLDIIHNRLTCSDEVFRIFGVPRGPALSYEAFLTYEAFLNTVHVEDREAVDQAWTAAMHGSPFDIEHRIVVGEALKWVRERAKVQFGQDGRAVEGIGTVQDITERKHAEEDLLQLNRAHRALSKCNEALIRATDESAWLEHVCRLIVDEVGYRFCWVGHAEQDDARAVRPVALAGFDEGYLQTLNITWADTERGRGPVAICIRTGKTQITKDVATDPRFAPWRSEALKRGYASSLAIPLLVDAKPFGALAIYSSETDAFSDEEVRLLSELADDLGYGITTLRTRAERARVTEEIRTLNAELEQRVKTRTAELQAANALKDELLVREQAAGAELAAAHEREIKIGFRIQQMLLLDQPPSDVPGLRVAALTIPSQRIDGDFYDFFKHENQCLDLIVADVMGKGVPAALLAAATKSHFLEALCHLMAMSRNGTLPEPKEIVTLAHAAMVRQLIDLESFVTLCYARFDVTRRRLALVDCGHAQLIHVRARTGRCETPHGDNLPLGIRVGEIYDQIAVPFDQGDMFLFYSDGITEAHNVAGELFGADRLLDCVRTNRELEPEPLVEAIRKTVFTFAESDRVTDDLTCVAVKVGGPQPPLARAEIEIPSDVTNLSRAREFVRTFCSNLPGSPLHEGDVALLELAVNEAVSNVMKHAYHGRTDQWIHVEAEAFPEHVAILLHHLGDPFEPSAVPAPPLDGSRESGFGIHLITRSVDDVRYYRDERGRNCIALVKVRNS